MTTTNSVGELIHKIAPLYNSYTQNSKDISGTEALEIMREIGSILSNYIENNSVAPHNLYRQIYGKSEGTENVEQKSYITREFLGRCYRIYKIFPKKGDIKRELPNLVSFTAFREAMPFFDNEKYKLSGKEKEDLLRLLNSSAPKNKIINAVRALQKKYIGIKNPRTQKLGEVMPLKDSFVELYKYMQSLLKLRYKDVEVELNNNDLTKDDLNKLSQNIIALTNDRFQMQLINEKENRSDLRKSFIQLINEIANEKTLVQRRRVRKVINPSILVHIADMVTALSSEIYYDNFKQKYMK